MTIEKRLLEYNPDTGITEYFYFDHATGDITIEEVSDVETVIEQAKALANERSGFKGDMKHVAYIPAAVMSKLMHDGIAQDPERLKHWLNDRDNRCFRTLQGKV